MTTKSLIHTIFMLIPLISSVTLSAAGSRVDGDLSVNGTFYLNNSSLTTMNGLLRDKGVWAEGKDYSMGDVVQSDGSSYVCTLANINIQPPDLSRWSLLAASGLTPIVTTEAPGSNCTNGGTKIQIGANSVSYVCNGSQGIKGDTGNSGSDGISATITAEIAGLNCPNGGVKVQVGTGTPQYVCNGAKGDTGATGSFTLPTLFKPVNFSLAVNWQYLTSTTATNTVTLTSGDYVVPGGVNYLTIEAIGGSGGGGGTGTTYASYSGGGGGGAGEYAGTYLAVTPGSTINIAYGAAGTGGAPLDATGGNGGNTTVTYNSIIYVKANGGKGGGTGGYTTNGGAFGNGGNGSIDLQHINGTSGATGGPIGLGGAGGTGGSGPVHITPNIGGKGGNAGGNNPGTSGTPGSVRISYM